MSWRAEAGTSLAAMALALAVLASACGDPIEVAPAPGDEWFDGEGERVPASVVSSHLGPEQCGWSEVGFLNLRWPVGDVGGDEVRQYVGDPSAVLPPSWLEAPFDPAATLPRRAEYSGLHTDEFQLWVGEDHELYVYLVSGATVEAWPRADPPITCETAPA